MMNVSPIRKDEGFFVPTDAMIEAGCAAYFGPLQWDEFFPQSKPYKREHMKRAFMAMIQKAQTNF